MILLYDFENSFQMLMAVKNNKNSLQDLCIKELIYRYCSNSKQWESIDACNAALSEEDVCQLTFGTYRITQADYYIKEHLDETGQ